MVNIYCGIKEYGISFTYLVTYLLTIISYRDIIEIEKVISKHHYCVNSDDVGKTPLALFLGVRTS